MSPRRSWDPIIERAKQIATDYNLRGVGITLRGLHYRLVAARRPVPQHDR
jgi:hypothetical protein